MGPPDRGEPAEPLATRLLEHRAESVPFGARPYDLPRRFWYSQHLERTGGTSVCHHFGDMPRSTRLGTPSAHAFLLPIIRASSKSARRERLGRIGVRSVRLSTPRALRPLLLGARKIEGGWPEHHALVVLRPLKPEARSLQASSATIDAARYAFGARFPAADHPREFEVWKGLAKQAGLVGQVGACNPPIEGLS